jgi:CheY-like chemotaxis protein
MTKVKNKKSILLIDDYRDPDGIPKDMYGDEYYSVDEVEVARTYQAGIDQLQAAKWDMLLLDNDLGEEKQGRDILKFLEENIELLPKRIFLVTANPVAGHSMMLGLIRLEELGLIEECGWKR